MREVDYGDRKPLLKFISKEIKMTKYIDRYYLNWEVYGIKFGGEWWQPWVNTLVYMPIDNSDTNSTVYDHSTNQTNFSWYWTASYDTLTSGKKVAVFDGTNWIYVDSQLITSQPCTVNLYVYRNWNQNNDNTIFAHQADYNWIVAAWFNSSDMSCFYDQGGSLIWLNDSYTTNNQEWYNLVFTISSWTITTYINWQLIYSDTGYWPWLSNILATSFWFSRNISWNMNFRYMNGKMWSMIIEDKARTAQEISDYYNQTKSLYWIS